MAITIDEATMTITVEQSDLTFVSGTLYDLDTNAYRLAVGALLDDERYIWMDPAFNHNGEVTIAGVTLARVIEQINGYNITFENITYSVRLVGSNNNLFDIDGGVLNPSGNVTVIPNNSAGLQTFGLSAAELAGGVWDAIRASHSTAGTMGESGNVVIENKALISTVNRNNPPAS